MGKLDWFMSDIYRNIPTTWRRAHGDKREREGDDDDNDDDDDDDTLLLKDRDLSTGRLVYKSVPDDKYNNQ